MIVKNWAPALLLSVVIAVPFATKAAPQAISSRFDDSNLGTQVKGIREVRATNDFFDDLGVTIAINRNSPQGTTHMAARVNSATDSTGQSIFDAKHRATAFQSFDVIYPYQFDFRFKNSARGALAIRDITGEIEFFDPTKDASATVQISDILQQSGQRITAPGLTETGLEIIAFTDADYKELQTAEAKAAAEKDPAQAKAAQEFVDAFKGGLGLFSFDTGSDQPNPKKVVLRIKNPNSTLESLKERGLQLAD